MEFTATCAFGVLLQPFQKKIDEKSLNLSDLSKSKLKVRHFTSTAIVAVGNATLVHWHRKVQAWLAPGGHVEPNEDPVQAMHREVKEETGLNVRIIQAMELPELSELEQIAPPYTVMIEDVFDQQFGEHQHIDFTYLTTPVTLPNAGADLPAVPEGWHWVEREALLAQKPLLTPAGEMVPPPEDVLKLGITAIDLLNEKRANGGTAS